MRWDFFTVMSVVSGVVLVIASLGGDAVGPASERGWLFVLGAGSVAFGVWVANQTSGIYFFSIAPAVLAAVIVVRAVQKASRPLGSVAPSNAPPTTGSSSSAPADAAPSEFWALRAAQPQQVREAVRLGSQRFTPAFGLLKSQNRPEIESWEPLDLSWTMASGMPSLADGEELRATWHGRTRVKVSLGLDLGPTEVAVGARWVTAFDGIGFVALTSAAVVGIVTLGESILGRIDRDAGAGIAMWKLPLERCVSVVAPAPGGVMMLSTSSPASHVSLSELRSLRSGAPTDVDFDLAGAISLVERVRSECGRARPISDV